MTQLTEQEEYKQQLAKLIPISQELYLSNYEQQLSFYKDSVKMLETLPPDPADIEGSITEDEEYLAELYTTISQLEKCIEFCKANNISDVFYKALSPVWTLGDMKKAVNLQDHVTEVIINYQKQLSNIINPSDGIEQNSKLH